MVTGSKHYEEGSAAGPSARLVDGFNGFNGFNASDGCNGVNGPTTSTMLPAALPVPPPPQQPPPQPPPPQQPPHASIRLTVEEGALPESLGLPDAAVVQAIARMTTSNELLPMSTWSELEGEYNISGSVLSPLQEAWEPIQMLFSACAAKMLTRVPDREDLLLLLCASFFIEYI